MPPTSALRPGKPRRRPFLPLTALSLFLAAFAAPASAADQSLAGLWQTLVCWLAPGADCAPVQEVGCGLDPGGKVAPPPQEVGCGIDPGGQPLCKP